MVIFINKRLFSVFMENGIGSYGYVRIITAADIDTLEKAVNKATKSKKFEVKGFLVETDANYSALLYFYDEKPREEDLGQDFSAKERWEIERNSILDLIRLHGEEDAAKEHGFSSIAALKKHYKLDLK